MGASATAGAVFRHIAELTKAAHGAKIEAHGLHEASKKSAAQRGGTWIRRGLYGMVAFAFVAVVVVIALGLRRRASGPDGDSSRYWVLWWGIALPVVVVGIVLVATIGTQGVVTRLLDDVFGLDIFAGGAWIYALPGLIPAYVVFQVPLMVITFMPALAALKPQWVEAHLTLGGTRASFWPTIGFPVLAPSFLASFLLLFANAFSSYATAAALASQGSQIVPLQIRTALTSETVLGRENLAGALALGMILVVGVVMAVYALIQRRAARWQS
jgi:ABC-type sulfate transport system permease component